MTKKEIETFLKDMLEFSTCIWSKNGNVLIMQMSVDKLKKKSENIYKPYTSSTDIKNEPYKIFPEPIPPIRKPKPLYIEPTPSITKPYTTWKTISTKR
jgi:hypothetical protein